jgi:hypothetical protein
MGARFEQKNSLQHKTLLMTVTNLASEFRPYYEEKTGSGGKYMLWYDYAVIKLNHLFESIDHIGLTQKLDASLRLW